MAQSSIVITAELIETETGLWCPVCLLPSAVTSHYRFELKNVASDHGSFGTCTFCPECHQYHSCSDKPEIPEIDE